MHPWLSQRNSGPKVDAQTVFSAQIDVWSKEAITVADVHIEDGIIRITNLDVQDPKAAAVLAAYPQVRWAEITRRALKIGLGYLKGGERE
jgi:hypothetical protein